MKPGAVTVGYCYPREVDGVFMDSFMRFATNPARSWRVFDPERGGHFISQIGTRIASGRNTVVRRFLEDDSFGEWLWMIDTDHSFNIDALDKLLEVAHPQHRPIVGALCFSGGRSGQMEPTMYRFVRDGDGKGMSSVIEDWTPGSLVEVAVTGAACMLVHRTVLETIGEQFGHQAPMEWFAESWADGSDYGEDWTFCIRARQLGYKIFVHTGVEAPHHKSWLLDSTDWAQYKEDRANYGLDALKAQALGKRFGIVTKLGDTSAAEQLAPKLNRQQRRQAERKKVSA